MLNSFELEARSLLDPKPRSHASEYLRYQMAFVTFMLLSHDNLQTGKFWS